VFDFHSSVFPGFLLLGFEHHFQVRCCRLQFELQVRHPGRKKVKRNQREDGNTKTAGRGNERFCDAASNGLHSQLFVSEKTERPNKTGNGAQQTKQRCQSYQGVHDDEESASAFDLDAGSDLQCALQRGVLVIEAIPHHAKDRVA
jgi:hypothetical protein